MDEFSDETVERLAEANGVTPEEAREILGHMQEHGLLAVDADGDPVPAGPLAEAIAEAEKAARLFAMQMRTPFQLDLGGPTVAVAPGVQPLSGVLRIRRPEADPAFN